MLISVVKKWWQVVAKGCRKQHQKLWPPQQADQQYPYSFQTCRWQEIGGVIFLIAVLAPTLLSLGFGLAFGFGNQKPPAYQPLLQLFLRLTFIVIALVILLVMRRQQVFASGMMFFFLFAMAVPVGTLVLGQFGLLTLRSFVHLTPRVKAVINLGSQILAEGLLIGLGFFFAPRLWRKIKATIKEVKVFARRGALMIAIFTGLLLTINFIMVKINALLPGVKAQSNNQAGINDVMTTWYGVEMVVILTVVVAPVLEELATRHALFQMLGSKWLGFLGSWLFFAQMHIDGTNDWHHFLAYAGPSLVLCWCFQWMRYNVTYSIAVHSCANLGSLVISLAVR